MVTQESTCLSGLSRLRGLRDKIMDKIHTVFWLLAFIAGAAIVGNVGSWIADEMACKKAAKVLFKDTVAFEDEAERKAFIAFAITQLAKDAKTDHKYKVITVKYMRMCEKANLL